MTAERTFEPTRTAVGLARHFVLEEIADLPKSLLDSTAVMVSELASNAVLHARSQFRICIERVSDSVRIEVTDSGGGFPEPQLEPTRDAIHGRGLFIVQHMADEWGVTQSRDGREKCVWFRIDIPEPAVPSLQ
jgi:anti-sigma regulatory factor (Ser/Thr protein kinase)